MKLRKGDLLVLETLPDDVLRFGGVLHRDVVGLAEVDVEADLEPAHLDALVGVAAFVHADDERLFTTQTWAVDLEELMSKSL